MADLVDPKKLVSISHIAADYGYHPSYLTRMAAEGKLTAWYVGNAWITTRENIETYIRTKRPRGRPKKVVGKDTQKKHKNST
jgi:hypothetical protein